MGTKSKQRVHIQVTHKVGKAYGTALLLDRYTAEMCKAATSEAQEVIRAWTR